MGRERELFCTLPDMYEMPDVLVVPCGLTDCKSGKRNVTSCADGDTYCNCSSGQTYR
jgi:hypothetical protein